MSLEMHLVMKYITGMERLTIDRDEAGKMKRVYIEHPVLTPEPFARLQRLLSATVDFKPAPVDDLHLTLFHYGKPESLYAEANKMNPDLDFRIFMENFIGLLEHNIQLKSGDISVAGDSLDIFGDANKPALVVKLTKSEDLLRVRSGVKSRFDHFLENCGVADVDSFMKGSPNLKYQIDYNPHLTLGFPETVVQLPRLDLSGLQVVLGNPHLANVTLPK